MIESLSALQGDFTFRKKWSSGWLFTGGKNALCPDMNKVYMYPWKHLSRRSLLLSVH